MVSVRLRIPTCPLQSEVHISFWLLTGRKKVLLQLQMSWIDTRPDNWNCHLTKRNEGKMETVSTFFASLFNSTGTLWAVWSWVRGPLLQEHWVSICEHWNFKRLIRSVEWMFMGSWDSTQGTKGASWCYGRAPLNHPGNLRRSLLTGN